MTEGIFANGFDFNPFEVGNSMTVGWYFDAQEANINDMLNHIEQKYGLDCKMPASFLTELIDAFNIDYPNLPDYLRDKIDIIDVF